MATRSLDSDVGGRPPPGLPWLEPVWPVAPNVRALCTTRAGGVSRPPFDSLNVGLHVADTLADVRANRQRLAQRVGGRMVFMNQVHGVACAHLDGSSEDGLTADACLSTAPGMACTVMVADCLPVLFATAQGNIVAAAHAGWRGLVGTDGHGVLEATVQQMRAASAVAGAANPEILAWLGPCIGPQAFDVGNEVRAAFVMADRDASACFAPVSGAKWKADLPALARQRLHRAGVRSLWGNDSSAGWCTFSNPSLFFSYRRDGVCGRHAACVWLA